ncbi:MAG: error-prone DNA polymerase [Microthrixaceae bacterium]
MLHWVAFNSSSGSSGSSVPYAELHCHSTFSFLDGASSPESLAQEADRLGLDALALTDHSGFYGVVRFAEAARAVGLPTVFGAELTLNATQHRTGSVDPDGQHLIILARDPVGYACLAALLSQAQMAGEKGRPEISFAVVAEAASHRARGHWAVLTACRKGILASALARQGVRAAEQELRALVAAFGIENTFVELWDHGDPLDSDRNDALYQLARRVGTAAIATNNVHYGSPHDHALSTALAAIRAAKSLDQMDPWLSGAASAHLRSGAEQARRFSRYAHVVSAAAALGKQCAFDLALIAPQLPPYPCPSPEDEPNSRPLTESEYLALLVERGAVQRYGPRHAERFVGAWAQIDHELQMITALGFSGYFLIVWDIVEFCLRNDIYCQGRGSAANSAACYALGITKADAVRLGLLFERFLSPERDGPPDIDLDIESGRREEVIQYVYERYGRSHAAQVANVITYRARSAVRDAARALGFSSGQQDAWSQQFDQWNSLPRPEEVQPGANRQGANQQGAVASPELPSPVLALASQLEGLPRHLGIHSGGMVICDRPVSEVCPIEWARMKGRSVLQWDKEDCATAGLVKFDLLGLGMLTASHLAVDLIAQHHGVAVDLAELPQEDEVYEMLCRADSIGVFQVESRAQMATLPRLRPRCFYDLVVEVALIRPGPIQGGSVHPYIRRRKGEEPVTYLHPLLENALAKTLGVPLFQEQLMQMAIDVAGFTPSQADQLRQAMGSKRSGKKMAALRERFNAGTSQRGITQQVSQQIWEKIAAFAHYGFPESHSVSFAYLVYSSSWIKLHYPAAFCAALLNAQPMGFYSPHSLVQDARRHGVKVHTPDLNLSDWCATLEQDVRADLSDQAGPVVRLGISSVRSIGSNLAKQIADGRPYADMEDLMRRTSLNQSQLEALATAGVFGTDNRRSALWSAGAVAQSGPGRLPGIVLGVEAPQLPGMDDWEQAVADLWSTGIAPEGHPTKFLRTDLDRRGAVTAKELSELPDASKVLVAGVVTHRQRPISAAGITFVSLEDETGIINLVVSRGCWARFRPVLATAAALLVGGRLEHSVDGVMNVVAERVEVLPVVATARSRDFC